MTAPIMETMIRISGLITCIQYSCFYLGTSTLKSHSVLET